MNNGVKFQRNFILTASSDQFIGQLQIGYPFTLEFDIKRDNYSASNYAQIRLYNLSEYHRNLLLKDQNTQGAQFTGVLNVTLNAGYGPGPYWPVIFKGNVTRGYSVREGVNWITNLECFDGGLAFANATIHGANGQFPSGTSYKQIFEQFVNQSLVPYGVSLGAISDYFAQKVTSKGQSFSGNTVELLDELSNHNFFIDNLNANIFLSSEALSQQNPVVLNAQSGLLETPVREQSILLVKMLFEPRLVIGSVIKLDSITAVNVYNGNYKVISVHHRGTISAAVSGEAITEVGLQNSNILTLIGI